MQPADTLNITNEYIKSFFTKKTYLERQDSKLFKKISEYLIWVKQMKLGKSALEEATEDGHDPLLGKKMNQNKHKTVEEDKLKKFNNGIEADEDSRDSDEMLLTSRRYSDDETGDQLLYEGNFCNTSEDNQKHENLEIQVEFHNTDSS